MKKKTQRKPAKRKRTAEAVIKAIGELSKEEQEKLDQSIAYGLFFATFPFSSEFLYSPISISVDKDGQVFLGGPKGLQPLKTPLQLLFTLRDRLKEIKRIWIEPGEVAEKARKFDNMFGIKHPKAHALMKKLREEDGLSFGDIVARLKDAGITQKDGNPYTYNSVKSHCYRKKFTKGSGT